MTGSATATWSALVQRALLGTERGARSLPASDSENLQGLLNRLPDDDAERSLLAAAGILATYRASGQLPAKSALEPPREAPLESDDLPPTNERVSSFLTVMLAGTHSEVLREWLSLVAQRNQRAATAQLPALLEFAATTPFNRKGVLPVLGARGRWLAAQNPDWSWAAAEAPHDPSAFAVAWETGAPDERIAILQAARSRDAAAGRALLESTWTSEAASQRHLLLAILNINLSSDDEPFLERALDDRRQDVRRTAASLLCRISASALVARMTARAKNALTWKPQKLLQAAEIIVSPPTELDSDALRDGVDPKPQRGMGERAWWLTQIVGPVPPSTWLREWNTDARQAVAAAASSDWAQALLEGWVAAAIVHRDADWAEALLTHGSRDKHAAPLGDNLQATLLAVLRISRREALVLDTLRNGTGDATILAQLDACDHAWSEDFARRVLAWLRQRVETPAGGVTEYQLRELIPRLALHVPPRLAGADDNWPIQDKSGFNRPLERFISILTFRRQLAEELDR